MLDRKKFGWTVRLQDDQGQVVTRTIHNYWDPAREDAAEAIAGAAKGEAFVATGGQRQFAPISVERIEEAVAA